MIKVWPNNLAFRTRLLYVDFNEAAFHGEFSRQSQYQSHGAGKSDRWVGILTTTVLDALEIPQGEAFLASLGGLSGKFYAFDPDRRYPAATSFTSALWAGDATTYAGDATTYGGAGATIDVGTVDGASQGGNSLNTNWDVVSSTLALAGDYLTIHDQYIMLIANLITDGAGDATIEFQPALRVSPPDGANIYAVNPVMVARLESQYKGANTGAAFSGIISFPFNEVIPNG